MLHKSLFNLNEGQVALLKGTQLKIFSFFGRKRPFKPCQDRNSRVGFVSKDRRIDDRGDRTTVRASRMINEHGNDLDIPAAKL